MTVDELIGQMAENRAWIAGARVAIDFGDDGAVLLDGIAQGVRCAELGEPADTHIAVSWTDWLALTRGSLDPRRAINGSVAKIVKLEHAWRRLDGRNDDGFQVAPFPG